ncbi:hypothetical protein [Halosimplex sp. TS25]|uniref:hypothetical protein n=1 Tax=Halosimplex rarum TaxID=3396619 RepID=UPI0039E9968B
MGSSKTDLESKVSEIESKADEYENRENIDKRLEAAKTNLDSHNNTLRRFGSKVETFERKARILEKVLEEEVPDEVETIRRRIQDDVCVPKPDLIDTLSGSEPDLGEMTEQVRALQDDIESVTSKVQDRIDKERKRWQSDISTARGVQRIVSEDASAEELLKDMKMFLDRTLASDMKDVASLKSEWRGYKESFENIETDWDTFQEKHDLSDETIELLKKLSKSSEVPLSKASDTVINEMNKVEAIQRNVDLSI